MKPPSSIIIVSTTSYLPYPSKLNISFVDTTVFDLVGITDATTQTGINAGLSFFTWFCQLGFVYVGRFAGRRTILLWLWPALLLSLIGLTVASGVFANNDQGDTKAGVATVVMVWVFLRVFNCSSASSLPVFPFAV